MRRQAPALLRQSEGTLASVTADEAYDRDPVYQAAATRQPRSLPEVIIPTRTDTVLSTADLDGQSPRDRHVRLREPRGSLDMTERGRIGWQRATGYGKRNQAETAMARHKHLIGPKLRARSVTGQNGETSIAVAVLNTMIRTTKPVSVRVALTPPGKGQLSLALVPATTSLPT